MVDILKKSHEFRDQSVVGVEFCCGRVHRGSASTIVTTLLNRSCFGEGAREFVWINDSSRLRERINPLTYMSHYSTVPEGGLVTS